jgi:hypothetical protein
VFRAFDNVVVRQHQSVGRKDDAGAAALVAFDTHDGRPDGFNGAHDGRRIRVEQVVVVGTQRE